MWGKPSRWNATYGDPLDGRHDFFHEEMSSFHPLRTTCPGGGRDALNPGCSNAAASAMLSMEDMTSAALLLSSAARDRAALACLRVSKSIFKHFVRVQDSLVLSSSSLLLRSLESSDIKVYEPGWNSDCVQPRGIATQDARVLMIQRHEEFWGRVTSKVLLLLLLYYSQA